MALETALLSLLRLRPGALVGALSADAAVGAVDVPADLPLGPGHRLIGAGRLIELFAVPDQAILSKLWGRARSVGAAFAPVRLSDPEEESALVYFFNMVERYGVMIVVVTEPHEGDGEWEAESVADWHPAQGGPTKARVTRVVKDGSAMVTAVDEDFERLLGWPEAEIVGRRSLELVHQEDHEVAIDNWLQMLDFPGPGRPVRLRHRHRDGRWIWLEVTNHNRLADPGHGDVEAYMVDVSDEVAAHEAALAGRQLIEHVTEMVPIGLFHAAINGCLVFGNRRLEEVTGLAMGDSLLAWGRLGTAAKVEVAAAFQAARGGRAATLVVDVVDPQLGIRQCAITMRPLADAAGTPLGVTGLAEDVTQRLAERRALEARADRDAFTGCLNRSATVAGLQVALDGIGVDGDGGVAVIFFDLDGLKRINDRLGHLAGDNLILEISSRLKGAVRKCDLVGRFGGDEFVVVASGVRSDRQALELARSLAGRTLGPLTVDGEEVEARAGIGVAWTDDRDTQATWLLRQADAAMYRSKAEGRCSPVMAGS